MKKRRVLALLLALSLVVSGNGMTVLAAQQGADMPVLMSQEELLTEGDTPAESSDVELPGDDDRTETSSPGEEETEKEKVSGEEKESAEEEMSENSENPVETEPTVPKEDDAGQVEPEIPAEDGVNETPAPPAEDEVPEEAEPAAPTEMDGTEELPDGSEGNDVQDQESDTETAGYISENHAEIPEVVSVTDILEAQPYVSRIVTFTDDTGMQITYDANAEQQYRYVVDGDGVLTAVNVKSSVSENSPELPAAFSGNIELKQPEEGRQYTSIASGVFSGNTDITYVKLPAGVETIGKEAFKGCTSLKGVYLPSTVKEIDDSAFEGCTMLSQIAVPKTVTRIGDSAFKGDSRLHLVYMKDVDYCDLKSIGDHAFEGCFILSEFCSDMEFLLPSKVESIGEAAFKDCKAIKKVDFSGTQLTMLGPSAFMGCIGIVDLTFGKLLTLIPEHAFDGCRSLMAIHFANGKNTTIDKWAFANCYNLREVVLPQAIIAVKDYAFQGCTRLTRVEVEYNNIELGSDAFPSKSEAPNLVIIANKGSEGYKYALEHDQLPDEEYFYQYTVEDTTGSLIKDGKFPGGTVWVARDSDGKDVNESNNKQGVKSGENCYVVYEQTEEQSKEYSFVTGSLRCNGQILRRVSGKFSFTMPEGGAVITAEFQKKTIDNIKGTKVTVEFSDGEPLQNGQMDEYGYLGVRLKVGQTTRMFLLDEDGETIPASKISKFSSGNEKVATVTKGGVITAQGTDNKEAATTQISAVVKGGDGKDIVINRDVSVVTADAKTITLKASVEPDDSIRVEFSEGPDGKQFADIRKRFVSKEELIITLKANVYDETGDIGKKLTWKTSNTKVVDLEKETTEEQDPINKITVKKGCEGEATITVTAKNSADARDKEVTQKFVIRVYQDGFRLGSPTVTLNPNMVGGCTIDLISAYSKELDGASIKLYQEEETGTTPFNAKYDAEASSSNCKKFVITSNAPEITNGKYNVRVCVNNDRNEDAWLPLTITVSRKAPTPTIKFNSKKTKFNLFYRDGRINADSKPTIVTTEITKLGTAEIEKVCLEALTKSADDQLFEQNFVIVDEAKGEEKDDETKTNLSAGRVVIRRSDGNLQYTSKKKAAVTGYLVIYYKGYEDSAAKKMKVTMPTCSTAPSYALRETKGTYSQYADKQMDAVFELYDKKSKTKDRVVLGAEYGDTVSVDREKTTVQILGDPVIGPDGTIRLDFMPDVNGKLKLVLKNQSWDLDKDGNERELSYIYTVNVSSAKPTVKVKQGTITMNLNYPEKDASFELISNPKGIPIDPSQVFEPVLTDKNVSEIVKLDVKYENGKGIVRYDWNKIKNDQMVKAGTYKFVCEYPQAREWPEELKKVTLTVKVVDKKPTIKLGKGALQLNLFAYDSSQQSSEEQERTEVSFKVSEKPEGYTLAQVGTGEQATEIKCTNSAGAESHFNFHVFEGNPAEKIDDMLRVSLKDKNVATGTYKFSMTARYLKDGVTPVSTKVVKFNVKVYNNRNISLTVTAKGKINLVNREGEPNEKNGIIYTPKLKNLKGKITDVKIYDVVTGEESAYFDIKLIDEGKNEGKFFVKPKISLKDIYPSTPGDPSQATKTTTLEPLSEGEGTTTPEKPTEPGDTTTSEKPTETGGTTTPETPTEPGDTTTPEKPTEPGGTTTPETPTEPGGTTTPEKPTEPGGTTTPEKPTEPGDTTTPEKPTEPGGTTTPEKPTEPGGTTTPEKPTEPGGTTTPEKPTTPEVSKEYADLYNNRDYSVRIWVKVEGYAGTPNGKGGVMTNPIKIKTAQILPKVTTDKPTLDVYLSSKDYDASFIVKPKEGAAGRIEEVYFAESDKKPRESFELVSVPQADGSLKVIVHLKEAVDYPNGSSNNMTMYVKYKGQGTNTSVKATSFTINIRVN